MGRIRKAIQVRRAERAAYRSSINFVIDNEPDARHRHELIAMASRQGYDLSSV